MHRSIKQQNSLNNRAFTYANTTAIQQSYGAECLYCREVFVNQKKQSGYICKDCCRNTFR
jgi:hypothetical protein